VKTPLAILSLLALAGLPACSGPADQETQAKAQAEKLKESLDKANAVQQQLMDAEARRRESEEKAE
jgi:hypothetical protein